jgi:aspartate aminotransferase
LDHEYLAIDGLKSFTEASARLMLGADSPAIAQGRVSFYKVANMPYL